MECNKCGSDNTQRLEVIFDGGTQNINTKSKTAGAGFGGAFGIGGAVTKTNGTSQSVLALKASPPAKKSLKWPVIGLIVSLLFFANGASSIVVGLAIMASSGYFGYKAIQFNTGEWPGLYKHWVDCWMCHKCGLIYHHP
jgi:hypothetical protein